MAVLDPHVQMPSGRFARDTLEENYPDRGAWLRALFGQFPSAVDLAIQYCHPLIVTSWSHHTPTWRPKPRRCIIELWWSREPSVEERTEMAKAAVATFLAWHGSARTDWASIRVRAGRRHPAPPDRLRPLKP
jgi:hypothetical protein